MPSLGLHCMRCAIYQYWVNLENIILWFVYPHLNLTLPSCESAFTYWLWKIGNSYHADLILMWVFFLRVNIFIYPHLNLISPSCESACTYRLLIYRRLISGWSQPHLSLWSQSNQIYISSSHSDLTLMWVCVQILVMNISEAPLRLISTSCESVFTE